MSTESVQSIRDFAERYAASWCSQDPTQVAAFYEENGSLSVNEDPPALGREAITAIAKGFMRDFPDMRVCCDDLVLKDDRPVFHWTLTGTNTGAGGTGRAVRISGYEVWELSERGLIATSQGHFDTVDYRQQLGS